MIPPQILERVIALIPTLVELKVTLAVMAAIFESPTGEVRASISSLRTDTDLSRQGVITGYTAMLERGWVTRRAEGIGFVYRMGEM